jgi:hypothetical protein
MKNEHVLSGLNPHSPDEAGIFAMGAAIQI